MGGALSGCRIAGGRALTSGVVGVGVGVAAAAAGAAAAVRCSRVVRLRAAAPEQQSAVAEQQEQFWEPNEPTYICSSVTADTVEGQLAEIAEAIAAGVDIVELRLDFLNAFDPQADLKRLMDACTVPYIVTFRPKWEG